MAEVNFLRPHQVDDIKDEIRNADATLSDPHNQLDNRGAVMNRKRALENQLAKHEPPDINKSQEAQLVAMKRQIEERVRDGMLSHEEMRRAPSGAVDQHRRWEKKNKPWIQRLRNINLTLTKGSGDRDAGNIEGLRPRKSHLSMNSAILGKDQDAYSFPSQQFQANYDDIDWGAHRNPGTDFVEAEPERVDKAQSFVDSMSDLGSVRAQREMHEEIERIEVAAKEAADAGSELPDALKAG